MNQIRTASVPTQAASLHLKKLCKHFQHKVEVRFTDTEGQIDFKIGRCDLVATPDALQVQCSAPTPDELADVMDTIKRHFDRFAEKEGLVLEWAPARSS